MAYQQWLYVPDLDVLGVGIPHYQGVKFGFQNLQELRIVAERLQEQGDIAHFLAIDHNLIRPEETIAKRLWGSCL